MFKRTALSCALLAATLLVGGGFANAETIKITALGASITAGRGVGSGEAWPARLESMLRAKGYDVSVTVNAVSGDKSTGILSRADAAAAGARVVVFDAGNDARMGAAAVSSAQIAARIRSHGAAAVQTRYAGLPRQADGIHITAEGHAAMAARILPAVIAAIGRKK